MLARASLVLLLLLGACAGSVSTAPLLDGTQPQADAGAADASPMDAGVMGDGAAPAPDAQVCLPVPEGKYKGSLSGEGSGTIVFKVVAASVGQTFSSGSFKVTAPKVKTFPLDLAGIHCHKLTAAIARPEGTTGGTDLRGSIRADYRPNNTLFRGDWTMPFGEGTFKAKLQP
jgi:hypothetical protein